jgi:hypothetical protein
MSVNIPGFDSFNRPYIRDRGIDIHEVPGTVRRMRYGAWSTAAFEPAIAAYFGCTGCEVSYSHAGGWYSAQVVWDRDDVAYTVVNARPSTGSSKEFGVLLLESVDYGGTWRVHTLKPRGTTFYRFALERPYSPEPLEAPPAVLLWHDPGSFPPAPVACSGTPGDAGTLELVKPFRTSGGLGLSAPYLVSDDAFHIDSHAGGGTQLLTHRGTIYAAWHRPRRFSDGVNRCGYATGYPEVCRSGSVIQVGTFELSAVGSPPILFESTNPVDVTVSCPTNDGHNRPALVMDTAQHLHLVAGAHNCPFRYQRAQSPLDIRSWLAATPTLGTSMLCTGAESVVGARQTYAAFLRDRDDRLHLAYRRSLDTPYAGGVSATGYYLEYQAKLPGAGWTPAGVSGVPQHVNRPADELGGVRIVNPPRAPNGGPWHLPIYSNYFHQMTIDRYGHVYLLLSVFNRLRDTPNGSEIVDPRAWYPPNSGEETTAYKYSHLFVHAASAAPTSWEYASTQLFHDNTRWSPWLWTSAVGSPGEGLAGGAGDIDGDGMMDVVHAFYQHGLTVHIDRALPPSPTGARWSTRARRLTDGAQILQLPVLVGRVDGDARADLVWVYRNTSSQLAIRTHFSQANGHFSSMESIEADGADHYPDANYPIAPLIGDVARPTGTGADGRDDLLLMYRSAACSGNLAIRTKISLGDGRWTTRTHCAADGSKVHVQYPPKLGDVNGDGCQDLVFVFRDGLSSVLQTRIMLSNGDGTWAPSVQQSHTDGSMIHQYPHLLGDINGDGRADLIFLFRQSGLLKVRVKFARAGGFGPSIENAHSEVADLPHYRPLVARVNNDACGDLVFPYRSADGIYRLRTFFAVCDGTENAAWQLKTTTALP